MSLKRYFSLCVAGEAIYVSTPARELGVGNSEGIQASVAPRAPQGSNTELFYDAVLSACNYAG